MKVTRKNKIHSGKSEFYLPTDINKNEIYDIDVSDDWDYFTDQDPCLICGEFLIEFEYKETERERETGREDILLNCNIQL
jgi:hypothetical protein